MAVITHTGVAIAQTFRTARALKSSRFGFFLTELDSTGDVTVLLCETKNAKPDQLAVLSKVTVPYSELKGAGQETIANMITASMDAGKLYTYILLTTGNHRIQTAPPGSTEGQSFYGRDQDWIATEGGRDIKIRIYADKYVRTRTEVALQAVQLAGGITDLDYVVEVDEPDGTEVYLEAQIAGIWKSLKEPDTLVGAHPLIPLRAVFLGTSDLQASIKLGNGLITVRRPETTLEHLSIARTLPAAKQNIVVDLWLDNYDPADAGQELQVALHHGAGFATVTTGTAGQVDEDVSGTKRARFAFNAGAPISTYKIAIEGERIPSVPPYLVLERVDVAVS